MTDELTVIAPEPEVPLVHLVARNPQQMAAAQSRLATWLSDRRDSLATELRELETARDEAKRHKWKTSAFNTQLCKIRKQLDFYEKIAEAVAAGYTLIPNFPIDVFAIRVGRENAVQPEQYGGSHRASFVAERPDILSAGEGEYKSQEPTGRHFIRTSKDAAGNEQKRWYFDSLMLRDVDFPFAIARPEIMDATAEAMALRVFDQIGICPQTSKRGKGDPLIIGQIGMHPHQYSSTLDKPVSFLIAWYLDLRTL